MRKENKRIKLNLASNLILFIIIAIVLITTVFASLKIMEKNNVFINNENLSDEKKIGYQRLNEEDFEIDIEKNEITFKENTDVGTFCISKNPEGPTEDDKWIVTKGEKTVKLEELSIEDNETKKTYIYYLASNFSSMTDYDSSKSIYTIRNVAELNAFASKVNSGINFSGKTVYLISDIDLSSVANFTSIGGGSGNYSFAGTFDGNGYIISNLKINNPKQDRIGLFGKVQNGTIRNVIIKTGSVIGKGYVGGIVGSLDGSSVVEQCHNKGVSVTSKSDYCGRYCRLSI